MYFQDVSVGSLSMFNGSFGVHFSSSLQQKTAIQIGSKQLFAVLAQENCPFTSSKIGDFTSFPLMFLNFSKYRNWIDIKLVILA